MLSLDKNEEDQWANNTGVDSKIRGSLNKKLYTFAGTAIVPVTRRYN